MLAADPDFEGVGEAVDGREAVEQARELRPDVVVMDIRMPRPRRNRSHEATSRRSPIRRESSS